VGLRQLRQRPWKKSGSPKCAVHKSLTTDSMTRFRQGHKLQNKLITQRFALLSHIGPIAALCVQEPLSLAVTRNWYPESRPSSEVSYRLPKRIARVNLHIPTRSPTISPTLVYIGTLLSPCLRIALVWLPDNAKWNFLHAILGHKAAIVACQA
jgi:hypothetical protein